MAKWRVPVTRTVTSTGYVEVEAEEAWAAEEMAVETAASAEFGEETTEYEPGVAELIVTEA